MTEAYQRKPLLPEFQMEKEAGSMNIDAFSEYLLHSAKKAVDGGVSQELGFIVIPVEGGRLIFHESFLQIGDAFCQKYKEEVGLPDSEDTKAGRRDFIMEYERRYFEEFKKEQGWSREVLVQANTNLNHDNQLDANQQELITQSILELDEEVDKTNTIVCIPSIYDDPELYAKLGITKDDWWEFEVPYAKKASNGLVYASAISPVNIATGDPSYKIEETKISHDSLTYDLYRSSLKSGVSFMESSTLTGLHEGHHSYLEQVVLKIVGNGLERFPGRTFIAEAFANYREGSGKEKLASIYDYSEMMHMLATANDSAREFNYRAAPKLLGAMHELVQERDAYPDNKARYVYMQEKALLAALEIQKSDFPQEQRIYQFVKNWMNKLKLNEAEVEDRFNALNPQQAA